VYRLCRYDHITDALATLQWLHLPERVDFKVAVTAFHVLHGLAPPYLSQLVHVTDLPGRRRLRSSSTQLLHIPPFRQSTVGLTALVSCCSIRSLELLATGHSVTALFTHFPSTAQDISFL